MRLPADIVTRRQKPEPAIALINIIFLMLIFFLIAGTLAPPLDRDLTLVNTTDLEGREPPDALVIHADGSLTYRQSAMTPQDYLAMTVTEGELHQAVRLVPDREVPASRLIELSHELRELGASRIFVVTERSLQ